MYGNRRLARAQAALVALLYVFLCTFGTLTHTHAWLGCDMNEAESVAVVASPAAAHLKLVKHHPAAAPHCAFCDWQANSVSMALPIQHCVSPFLVALVAPCQVVIPVTVRIIQTSSRAPPAA
jgi:hypothetical protein